MLDAIIERHKRGNIARLTLLGLIALLAFGWGYAHATAQPDSASPLTIDDILADSPELTPEPEPKSNAKPSLTRQQRATFIAPTPSAAWKATYGRYVMEAALKHNLPPDLIMAVIAVESGFNITARNGTSYGLMQIKLTTAREFGLGRSGNVSALMNPATNIKVAANYLGAAWKLTNGDICAAVSRYNRGLGSRKLNASYCAKVARIMQYADYQVE